MAGRRAGGDRGAAEGQHPRVGADGRQAGDGHQRGALGAPAARRHAAARAQRGQPRR